jgi:hypothetical protein
MKSNKENGGLSFLNEGKEIEDLVCCISFLSTSVIDILYPIIHKGAQSDAARD